MRIAMAIVALALAAGCASQSGVIDTGGGNYFVSRQAATGISGMGNLRAEALREAATHCSAQGKAVNVVHEEQSDPPYIFGNYPRVDLTFTCVQA